MSRSRLPAFPPWIPAFPPSRLGFLPSAFLPSCLAPDSSDVGYGQMGPATPPPAATSAPPDRPYLLERVGEAAVVQVYADAFRDLPLREKTLVWHLGQAAIAGRDIFYDQRYAHNLEMRDVLEAILTHVAREGREEGKGRKDEAV